MPDMENNLLIDDQGRISIHDLTFMTGLKIKDEVQIHIPDSREYKKADRKSGELRHRVADLEAEIKRKSQKLFFNNTTDLEAQKKEVNKQIQGIEESKRSMEEEYEKSQKEGTWVFTAVLKKNFPVAYHQLEVYQSSLKCRLV